MKKVSTKNQAENIFFALFSIFHFRKKLKVDFITFFDFSLFEKVKNRKKWKKSTFHFFQKVRNRKKCKKNIFRRFFCGNFFHYGKAVSLILRIFYHAYMSISMKMAVMNSHKHFIQKALDNFFQFSLNFNHIQTYFQNPKSLEVALVFEVRLSLKRGVIYAISTMFHFHHKKYRNVPKNL